MTSITIEITDEEAALLRQRPGHRSALAETIWELLLEAVPPPTVPDVVVGLEWVNPETGHHYRVDRLIPGFEIEGSPALYASKNGHGGFGMTVDSVRRAFAEGRAVRS